ncbi:MAG TPA: hypothetical protein EYQ20_20365 [candidate division Zixibacteria bacterium]|nr:hypothetical protein [candidate division Zixibacteria bacterium]
MSVPVLILDYAMATPEINEHIACGYVRAGCNVDYRPFYPNLVHDDVNHYRIILLLAGRTPAYPSGMMSALESPLLIEYVENGGTLVLAPNLEGGEGANERYLFNQILADLHVQIHIYDEQVSDSENQYAAPLWERPFYQPMPGHPVSAGSTDRLAFDRSVRLGVGSDVSVPLTTFPTARPKGRMPTVAMAQAGKGLVVVAGRYILNAAGIQLRISGEPLAHPEWLEDSAVFLHQLTQYIVDFTQGHATWHSTDLFQYEKVASDSQPDFDFDQSIVLDHVPEQVFIHTYHLSEGNHGIDQYNRKLADHYAQLPDERLYGWIRNEGVRASWGSTVDWGTTIKAKEEIERVTDTLKAMDVNLFWGIANCQAVGGPGYSEEERNHVLQQWRWTAEALDGSHVKWYPTLDYRYFREEKTRCYGAQGQKLEATSPMDFAFWRENWRDSMLAMAEFSLDHPCIGGLTMDVELYGHPPAYNYYMCYGFEDECYFTVLDRWDGWIDASQLKSLHPIPLVERYIHLRVHGLLEAYFSALSDEVTRICRQIREDIWQVNPDLIIASYIFTTPCNWFDLGLYRGFSTPERPVILMTFNVRSGRMMEHLRRRGIYAYHTSVALLGMIKQNEYETIFVNSRRYGHGYWINSANSLLMADPNSVEAPARQGISSEEAVKTIYKANQKMKIMNV